MSPTTLKALFRYWRCSQYSVKADASAISDSDGIEKIEFQWFANGLEIQGANSDQYRIKEYDLGADIHAIVKITDGEGTVETKTSDALTISESEAPHH